MSQGTLGQVLLPQSWARDWIIERRLGAGAFATVYRAVRRDNPSIDTAIKVITIPAGNGDVDNLRAEGYSDIQAQAYYDDVSRQYISEIELMEQLKGLSNIVGIEDYKVVRKPGGIGNLIFIRMELLTPLESVMRQRFLTEEEVIKIGIDVCSALEICEARNILHRDIKPANIFFNDKTPGYVFYKLGDFGIARTNQALQQGLSTRGTPIYMAPEVFSGGAYDNRADLYSLGIALYRLLNYNMIPFAPNSDLSATTREEALSRRLSGERLIPPRTGSGALHWIILKACEYQPGRRFQSASEMKRALTALQNGTFRVPAAQPQPRPAAQPAAQPQQRSAVQPQSGHAAQPQRSAAQPQPGPAARPADPRAKDRKAAAANAKPPKAKKEKKKGKKGVLIAVLSVLVLAALGALAYFLFLQPK